MASNNKSFFIERTEYSVRLARMAHGADANTIEEVRESPAGTPEEVREFVQGFAGESASGYLRAHCAIYPAGRILRNLSLKSGDDDVSKNPEEEIASQLRVNPDEYILKTLRPNDGVAQDPLTATKEVFLCGAPIQELRDAQDYFVAAGVYPLRMELGSVASSGLLIEAIRAQNIEEPMLAIEIGEDHSHALVFSRNQLESAKPLRHGINSMVTEVRMELGLNDEAAARRLFYSDSFDFREMGPRLIGRLVRELQSMTGFYEVQTGQSITRILCTLLPAKLSWLNKVFASSLGMSPFELDLPLLLGNSGLNMADSDSPLSLYPPLGLLGLMVKGKEGAA